MGMLLQASDREPAVPLIQADATALPFASEQFDLAFSAYGAVPFVAQVEILFAEVWRILRPGGRWVFSVTHPIRWAFPDVPGELGLTADRSYFDRRPYVERDESGVPSYVEHHRTLGDTVAALTKVGFAIDGLTEPEWPDDHDHIWGGWSPTRGRLIPGTAIWSCRKAS
jgi:SAM-dependent methyltransferase